MAISRSFRVLGLYDVFTNLIPGAVLLLTIYVAFDMGTGTRKQSTALVIAAFAVLSLVAGHVIQAVASYWEDDSTLFGRTVQVARGEEDVTTSISITDVERAFWPLCKRTFNLSEDFKNYGRLIRLVLGHLEATPQTRALRFQALHSFHRSMGTVSRLVVLFVGFAVIIKYTGLLNVASYLVLIVIGLSGVCGWYLFGKRKKKFNKRFVEYLISDFYIDQTTNRDNSTFAK